MVVKSPDTLARAPGPPGRLFLVPAPLDFGCAVQGPITGQLPLGTLQEAARLGHWICENAKTLRACLARVHAVCQLAAPIQSLQIAELPREAHKKGDHLGGFDATSLLAAARLGHDIGLASEAGMPAIADPGSSVVRAAHGLGIEVVPLVGPVSMMLALAASGLNGQNFAFVGYLPIESAARVRRIQELESLAQRTGQTQLFIETPYRNGALLQTLLQALSADTRLAISCGLTLPDARSYSGTVGDWRRRSQRPDNATPAVFGIGR